MTEEGEANEILISGGEEWNADNTDGTDLHGYFLNPSTDFLLVHLCSSRVDEFQGILRMKAQESPIPASLRSASEMPGQAYGQSRSHRAFMGGACTSMPLFDKTGLHS